jgi:hypothetical protein
MGFFLGYTTKLILLNDFTRETLVISVGKGFWWGCLIGYSVGTHEGHSYVSEIIWWRFWAPARGVATVIVLFPCIFG